MGVATRQFRAFDREGLTREFAVPPHWEVSTITALRSARQPPNHTPAAISSLVTAARRTTSCGTKAAD
jgi:hypothetical protein